MICVHIPTDLVKIHLKGELDIPFAKIPPAVPLQDLEWKSAKDLGNKALKNNNPIIVAKHYTSALAYPEVKGSSSHQLLLYLNRAQALLDQSGMTLHTVTVLKLKNLWQSQGPELVEHNVPSCCIAV